MLKLRTCFIALVTLSGFSQAGEEREAKYYEELFTRAYVDGGKITFEPHYKINWGSIAPPYIKDINIDKPTKEQLDLLIPIRDRYSNSEIEFEADVPAKEGRSLNCYFISPIGINELNVLRLLGTARFAMGDGDKDGPIGKIWRRIYYGKFLSESSELQETKEGGFSLCSKESLEFEQSDSMLTTDDIKEYFLSSNSLSGIVNIDDPNFWNVVFTYSFRVKGEEAWYRFFQLSPDLSCQYACCYRQYFVTKLNSKNFLSWNMYECDT